MPDDKYNNQKIREYLLGEIVSENDIEEIEFRMLSDAEFIERVEIEESELVQEYVDGFLSEAERKSFETNYLTTPERFGNLNFARVFRNYVDAQTPETSASPAPPESLLQQLFDLRKLQFPKMIFVAAAFLSVCGLVFFVWHGGFSPSEQDKSLALLNDVYRSGRPFDARVSRIDYAPYINTRGGGNDPGTANNKLSEAELLLLSRANSEPSVENYHNLGRVYLLKKQFDLAITQFEKARQLNTPQSAALLNDLGSAYLEKGKSQSDAGKKLTEFTRALEIFDQSLQLKTSNQDALFNKALTLEALNLSSEARSAWTEYLKIDPNSAWSEEGRQRLQRISSNETGRDWESTALLEKYLAAYRARDDAAAYRLVSRNREMITNKLVSQQLVFLYLKSNDPEILTALKYLGEIEKNKSNDVYVAELARFYETVNEPAKKELQYAGELIKAAYEYCTTGKDNLALENFKQAQTIYQRHRDEPETKFCDYWIGYCLARTGNVNKSAEILEKLVKYTREKNYKWLNSQALDWQSLNLTNSYEFTKAFTYNDQAFKAAGEVSDLYNTQKTLSRRAAIYRYTKNYAKSIEYFGKALSTVADAPEASLRQKRRDYDQLSEMLYGINRYSAAESYEKESLNIALALDDPSFIAASQMNIGLIVASRNRINEAFEYFNESRKQIPRLFGSPLADHITNRLDLFTADILRKNGACGEALNFYSKAENYFVTKDSQPDIYEIRKGRMLCYYAGKDQALFEEQLAAIIEFFRHNRKKILDEQSRSLYFDGEQDVYDIAAAYAVEKNDLEAAFDYVEESHARSLLDLLNELGKIERRDGSPEITFTTESTVPLKLKQVQKELPGSVQLVQYTVLADRILIWVIDKENVSVTASAIDYRDLKELVQSYLNEVSNSGNAAEESADSGQDLSTKLYERLISPVENKLNPDKEICFIPDKELLRLPFASLNSPADGEYLLRKYRLFAAPSASVLIKSSQRAEKLNDESRMNRESESLLAIGDPDFDLSSFPGYSKLPAASREAREISSLYRRGSSLTEDKATKAVILNKLSETNIFHYAGHYLVSDVSPLYSGLLTAGARREADGNYVNMLSNFEIVGRRLTRTKLAVLSSCQSGIEQFYNGEGALGGARSYLAAGVPVVVASQWPVDSEATSELMINFHRYRQKDKLSSAEALRRAQLAMLEHQNRRYRHPYYWASFVQIGGYAQY